MHLEIHCIDLIETIVVYIVPVVPCLGSAVGARDPPQKAIDA